MMHPAPFKQGYGVGLGNESIYFGLALSAASNPIPCLAFISPDVAGNADYFSIRHRFSEFSVA
jgi:hypothetical protein